MIASVRARRSGAGDESTSGGGWRPLTLRWRRRPKGRPPARTEPPTAAAPTFWLPQFHLHLGSRAVERMEQRLAAAASTIVTRYHHLTAVTQHHWSVNRVARVIARSRVPRTSSAPTGGRTPVSRAAAAPPRHRVRPGWTPAARERMPVLTRPPQRPPSGRTFEEATRTASHHARLAAAAPALRRRGQVADGEPRLAMRRHRTPQPAVEMPPSPAYPNRAPDLTWRRAPAPVTAPEVIEVSRRAFSAPARESARSIPPDAGLTTAVAAGPAPSSTPQAFHFDSALVDRLTDDVIRRVERRVRIERERRGL